MSICEEFPVNFLFLYEKPKLVFCGMIIKVLELYCNCLLGVVFSGTFDYFIWASFVGCLIEKKKQWRSIKYVLCIYGVWVKGLVPWMYFVMWKY